MSGKRNSKRNSLPSLSINNFFVSKRASMFEVQEESYREKRERSPCGILEVSERRLEARKENEKKKQMVARRKHQADPYEEESTGPEEEEPLKTPIESKFCAHAHRSVYFPGIRKMLKTGNQIGVCTECTNMSLKQNPHKKDKKEQDDYSPVIWMCLFCGHQGCDKNFGHEHAYKHYQIPRSDPHCLVLSTDSWIVWCYNCDNEVVLTSSKRLHEAVQFIKRHYDMAPKQIQQASETAEIIKRPTYSDIIHTKHNESSKSKNNKNSEAPTVHVKTHIKNGQKLCLAGKPKSACDERDLYYLRDKECLESEEQLEDEEDVELKPLDLILPEGGALSCAFAAILKDMHSLGKTDTLHPGHLFGQICKKSTQFQGYEQQDAHELLRCLLDAVRNEEIIRAKKAILRGFGLSEKTDPNTVTPRLKAIIKGYGRQATQTIIDQIFGGQLISTVFCEECHWSSQVFEPFMDLSLSVNEEKGKPKKSHSDDDTVFESTGVGCDNYLSPNWTSDNRQQIKKPQKLEKKEKLNKGQHKGGVSLTSNFKGSLEDVKNIRVIRRLTEKRRPGDVGKEFGTELREGFGNSLLKKGESSKFRLLVEARNARRRADSSGGDDDGEELEYDQEEDEEEEYDDNHILVKKVNDKKQLKETIKEEQEDEDEDDTEMEDDDDDEEDEEEEEEEEEEDDADDETSEEETSSEDSLADDSFGDSRPEISDADVEDNTDSERGHHNTRQPSIVVERTETESLPSPPSQSCLLDSSTSGDQAEQGITCVKPDSFIKLVLNNVKEVSSASSTSRPNKSHIFGLGIFKPLSPYFLKFKKKYLMLSNSTDQLSYNSASDTSERYFTASEIGRNSWNESRCFNGNESDDFDHIPAYSGRSKKCTCGSSGDLYSIHDSLSCEDLCTKLGHLRMRKRFNSRENLLANQKRGSSEALHIFADRPYEKDEYDHRRETLRRLKQEWISKSLTTLAPRYQSKPQECSIMSCLANFTAPELLTGKNKISCESCIKLNNCFNPEGSSGSKSNASKQLLILSPPSVLTLHLKRFHHVGSGLAKTNRHVQFPLVLDVAPFTSSMSQVLNNMSKKQNKVLYSLYAVVEHSGRLNSGHYVAYVRCRPKNPSRLCKSLLNLKPSSQFEINQLVIELAEKLDLEESSLSFHSNNKKKIIEENDKSFDIKNLETEVREGRWFYISDACVSETNINCVLRAQAYILLYERVL